MTVTTPVPTITLNDGNSIPTLGFGVWQIPDDQAHSSVARALEVGYRSIDTAAIYGNEEGVGRAIAESGVPRGELFITTKLWNADQGYDSTLAAFDTSAAKLGLDYVDLYLIHWPAPARGTFIDTFKAFVALKKDGRVRSIGVSNFTPAHLEQLIDAVGVVPVLNQVELHPGFVQAELREFHTKHGIATEAWSPLGQGKILDDPTIGEVAATHGKTPAQAIIRWHLQVGNVVIPKSATPARIESNFDVFDFELTPAQLTAISGVADSGRFGLDPEQFNGS